MFRIIAFALLSVFCLNAAVTKILLVDRTDVPGYAYERIVAKVHFAVDPKNPANRVIRDIDLAPKNENGLVEFAADLYVLKPRNPVEGNGTILLEVNNRGRKGALNMFNFATGSLDPKKEGDFGDGYLLKQGYTVVWVGWQPDVPADDALMRIFAPKAKLQGQTITGLVRSEFIPDKVEKFHTLADRTHIPYNVRAGAEESMTLTVRDSAEGARQTISRKDWQLAREEFGKPVPDRGFVYLAAGFQPGKIYEAVYEAQDPTVVGLGPAAIRDVISFLKYEDSSTVLLGDQSAHLKRAIGFGTSQSGRFLRTYLYYGFNRDEKDRKVFDGVWAHVAGAGKGSFNHRFAQPSRDGHPFMNLLYPTDIFPFTDLAQSDAETGLTDGLLQRTKQDKVMPKIFYTNGSYEYWGRSASLIHTDIDAKSDFGLAADSRAYLLSGTQHGAGTFPPRANNTQYVSNPNDYRYIMRGLLTAMNAWLTKGVEPPPSQVPSLARKQLVSLNELPFPKLPKVEVPKRMQRAWRADYGPEFRSHGIVSYEPPKLGKPFPTLIPQVDKDGNEVAGIRLPEIQVPLATYTGWNLRAASIGSPHEIFSMVGSFFPFAKTKAEREKSNDPRPSVSERYPSKQDYLTRISEAARTLAKDRYILEQDITALEKRASAMWDALAPQ